MLTLLETAEFGEDIAARLRGDDSLESITARVVEKIGEVTPENFLTWCTCVVVEPGSPLEPRLRQANALWAQEPEFRAACARYHAWRRRRLPISQN